MGILDKLMGKSEAGAGRGFVNPPTIAEMEDAKRSPAEREARQMMRDRKAAKDAEAAYNKAVSSEGMAKGGMTSKYMSFSKTGKPDGMKSTTKMASGGSASKRADGIATKGKTRGTMVKMNYGGKC